jgi:hypothetical protein
MLFDSLLSPLTVKHLGRCVYCKAHAECKLLEKPSVVYCNFDDANAKANVVSNQRDVLTTNVLDVINKYARLDNALRTFDLFKRLPEPVYVLFGGANGNGVLGQACERGVLIFPQSVRTDMDKQTVRTDMLITLLHEYYHIIYADVNECSDERADLFAAECAEKIANGFGCDLDIELIWSVRRTASSKLLDRKDGNNEPIL